MTQHNHINQLITDNMDVWTSAIKRKSSSGRGSSKKIELYGIKKLRELILELAVRGKLVPQDPNDEPASVLLERIAQEKAQLVKEGKIKKPKTLPEISEDEKPFELPEGWEFVRLGDIGVIFNGNSVNARLKENKYTGLSEGFPFIATKDVGYGFENLDYQNGVLIPFDEPKFKIARKNSVLMCAEGGSAGKKCGIVEQDVCFGNKLFAIELHGNFESKFILSTYLTPTFFEQFSGAMTGIIGGISSVKFGELLIPAPPESEQHRIVAKVDELMALCDQLEAQTESSLEAHQTLVTVLLDTLVNSQNAQELTENWMRISGHFDTLFTTEHSIDQLKQTILQLAVMGKLVEQNPNDEPASALLERIAAEKEELVKQKKIKKQKPLPPISDDEKPFKLPRGWEWCRLGNISILKGGFAYKSAMFAEGGNAQVIRMGNIRPDMFRFEANPVFIPQELAEKTFEYEIFSSDILLTMTGTNGKRDYLYSLVVNEKDMGNKRLFLNQRLCLSRMINVDSRYTNLVLKDARLSDAVFSKSTGTANQANIGMEAIQNWVLPVSPLKQQHRIVAKVDELMAICDQLKARLSDAQTTQLNLADALVEQAL